MKRQFRVVLAFASIFILVATALAAITGDLEGTVYDPSGAVVPDAKVTIRHVATGLTRVVTTNSRGEFAALQLDLGEYTVTVEKAGLRSMSMQAVVRSAEKTRLTYNLTLGPATETVTVEGGRAPILDVNTSQVNTSISSREITTLPNQGRDLLALAVLAPGTTPVTKDNPFLGTGSFNSNGSRGRANNITVDNITSTDISTTGSSGLGTFSVEAIQEFKVITNNFSAEYGRNSGAQVQIITKSGSNSYHGTAYWYHQNSVFNARDYFDTTGDPTPFKNNDWGFYATGPVIKDKLFVSGHYGGAKARGAGSTQTATVLTPAQVAAITSPASAAVVKATAVPTDPSGHFSSSAANSGDQHAWSLKVDSNTRGGKDVFSMGYGENPNQSIRPGLVFVGTRLPNYGANVSSAARKVFFRETHSFSSAIVNEFRFGFGRSNPFFPASTTLTAPFAPRIAISGFDQFGESNIIPQGRVQNTFQWSDTVSWVKGRHGFKFGGDYQYYQANSVFDSNVRGTASFGSVADFQAGKPLSYTQNFGNSARHNRSRDYFAFAQDDVRITRDLTLNLGVRFESSGGVSEINNILSNLETTQQGAIGGGGTGPLGTMVLGGSSFARNNNWAPRVGFAYNPQGGKLVFRGGYGIAYDYIFLNPITNLRFSPPFIPSITLTTFTGTNTWDNLLAGKAQAQADAIAAIGTFLATQKNFGSISAVDRRLENPRNQQFTFGVEYEAIPNLVTKLSYIGSRNDHLQVSLPLNLVNPSVIPAPATSAADEAARLAALRGVFLAENGVGNNRLDPRFNTVTQVQSTGTSSFDSLQFEVIERMAHGLGFHATYTWGHGIDDVSDSLNVLVNDSANIQDPRNLSANRANTEFDLRHRFTFDYTWQIPFAHNTSGLMKKVLDGWMFGATFSAQTGLPATIFAGARRGVNDILLVGNSNVIANGDPTLFQPVPVSSAAAALIPAPCARGVNTSTSAATICNNTSNFPLTQPLLGNAGNSGRNRLRLSPFNDLDWTILKETGVTERVRMQFRWEFYNLLNHPNFAVLDNTLTSPTFGTYSTTATDMRKMQGGLKVIF